MVIGQLDLCMVHLTPVGVESKVAHRKKREVREEHWAPIQYKDVVLPV